MDRVMKLNVGGQFFSCWLKKTLFSYEGSWFSDVFGNDDQRHEIYDEASDSYFIDRDPELFQYVLNFLRTKTWILPEKKKHVLDGIEIESKFFKLPFCKSLFLLDTKILETQLQLDVIAGMISKTQQMELKKLYRKSEDGDHPSSFHRLCNGKGPTLTLIKSGNGNIFGGYTALDWNSNVSGQFYEDETSFLFSIKNPWGLPPCKYDGKKNENHIYCYKDFGPCFGLGPDLCVLGNNFIGFPNTFLDDISKKGNLTFTGVSNFVPDEIEVFSVNFIHIE